MTAKQQPVIIAGAGPVGICLALYLAQRGLRSILIERFDPQGFLDQEPRAGSIHPATLEMLDDLGLYQRLERRGLIAPTVQYWDRETDSMFAEFDHAVLKNDTRFPYVLQCERTKIIDEAMQVLRETKMCDIRMSTEFVSFTQDGNGVEATVTDTAWRCR